MRRRLTAAAVLAAAASIPGAVAAGGIRLSATPVRLTLTGAGGASITVRNPGSRPLLVYVSRAGLARSPHGRPRVRPARAAAAWLRLRPRRLRLAPHGVATVHVGVAPPRRARPGDHPALVLLTTRPLRAKRVPVRVRLRVGIVVLVRVPGRVVRRLEPRSLTVRKHAHRRLLELHLVNRGNAVERLGGGRLRLVLLRHGRTVAILRPRRQELLPHSSGIAEFVYRGRVRGAVVARIDLRPSARRHPRVFRIRL